MASFGIKMKDYVSRDERMKSTRKRRRDTATSQTSEREQPVDSSPAKKPGWIAIAVFLVIATFAGIIGKELGGKFASTASGPTRTQRMEDALSEAAAAINRQGPRNVDAATRLDGAFAGPGRSFRYDYTVLGDMGRRMNKAQLETSMADVIHRGYCTGDAMKSMRTSGVVVTYRYADETERLIGHISVGPQACLQ